MTDPTEYIVDVLPTDDRYESRSKPANLSTNGTSTGGTLNAIVDQAFGQLLGQQRPEDAADFQTALTNAFVEKRQGNQTVYEWQPSSYTTRTRDLGGSVTGAQASLYYRAKAILKDVLRLLDGLRPLDPAADPENGAAARSVVHTEMTELVKELGLPGGPRTQRVDNSFRRLLGTNFNRGGNGNSNGSGNGTVSAADADNQDYGNLPPGSSLRDLARVMGLQRSRINTVTEEENYSNFLILRDYVESLQVSWQQYKTDTQTNPYLGPLLVDISRALAVVAESVQETYRLMNRHFLGPKERESVVINFINAGEDVEDTDTTGERTFELLPGENYRFSTNARASDYGQFLRLVTNSGTPKIIESRVTAYAPNLSRSMTVAELLGWALEFATHEGPTLAEAGGKIGISKSLEETSFVLMVLATAASEVPTSNSAFRRQGVVRALQDLSTHLYEVYRLATGIESPVDEGLFAELNSRIEAINNRAEDIDLRIREAGSDFETNDINAIELIPSLELDSDTQRSLEFKLDEIEFFLDRIQFEIDRNQPVPDSLVDELGFRISLINRQIERLEP